MDGGAIRLGIDYGTAFTVALLAWPDGRTTIVSVDGAGFLSSSVFVDDDTLLVGAAAWPRAATEPDRLVTRPAQHLREGAIEVAHRKIEPVDLVAATLRRVSTEVVALAGAPVADVTMTVPASWGPQRRTLLRRAAARAGLGQPNWSTHQSPSPGT